MVADQSLIAFKRGFYACNPSRTGQPLNVPLIATQLYGPSSRRRSVAALKTTHTKITQAK